MKSIHILLFTFLAFALLPSCNNIQGSGEIIQSERSVNNFTEINSSISGKVTVSLGNEYKVTVNAQQNIADVLETVVENGALEIKYKTNTQISTHKPVEVHVSLPNITTLTLRGSGDIIVLDRLNADKLTLKIAGSGDIIADEIKTNELNAAISGSGTLNMRSGIADEEKLKISGSGTIDVAGLKSRASDIVISGSGKARVNVSEQLNVKISGSGTMYYSGDPMVTKQISGSGSIQKL